MRPFFEFLKDPREITAGIARKLYADRITNDKVYLDKLYRAYFWKKMSWDNPKTYCEKIQWLKVYDRNPLYTTMVDKVKVKDYVRSLIGGKYVIPMLGSWEKAEDIDWDSLPNQFVLKCNHDSGSIVVVKDKAKADIPAITAHLNYYLNRTMYNIHREWAYKNVERRILAEEYIPSLGHRDSVEWKLTCINGEVKVITLCEGIAHAGFNDRTNDHFNKDWTRQDWSVNYKSSGKSIQKPEYVDLMVELSEKIAGVIPYVRVDWYVIDGELKFGEITFYTWGGFCKFKPKKWDRIMGDWITLPSINR